MHLDARQITPEQVHGLHFSPGVLHPTLIRSPEDLLNPLVPVLAHRLYSTTLAIYNIIPLVNVCMLFWWVEEY